MRKASYVPYEVKLRDQFALKALEKFDYNSWYDTTLEGDARVQSWKNAKRALVEAAWDLADLMMVERERSK